MTNQTSNTKATYTLWIVLVAVLLFASITPSFGQKGQVERATSRDGLAAAGFLTSGEISDDLDGNDDEYFYKFKAGPGKLTLTVEVTAGETNAGATLDLIGATSKAILSNLLVQAADGGTEQIARSVNLVKAQEIIIRIKGMRYGSGAGYPGVYKIRLEGSAVKFNDAAPNVDAGEEKEPVRAETADKIGSKQPEARGDVPATPEASILPATAAQDNIKKTAGTAADGTDETRKPDAVDRAIEKGKAKSKKVLDLLNKVKTKIPD